MVELRVRLLVLLAVCGTALSVTLPATAAAQTEPTCFGRAPTIVRGDGNDVITGTRRNDVIFTGAGNDHVDGGGGNDRICTGLGDDLIGGGNGNDLLDGGLGRDQLLGRAGADQAIGGPVLLSRWECLGGQWHLVTYNMSTQPATRVDDINTGQPCVEPPPPPTDRATSLDGDRLLGGTGADRLFGGGGNDGAIGGSGNDRVFGHLGNDALGGGAGNDRLVAGPVFMTRWECRNNTWHLVTYDESVTPPREVDDIDTEVPCASAITPPITPPDNDGAGGGSGADFLSGGFGDDLLLGQAGRDRLRGGFGDDLLLGQAGRDRLRGGSGEDRLEGGPGGDNCRQGEDLKSC